MGLQERKLDGLGSVYIQTRFIERSSANGSARKVFCGVFAKGFLWFVCKNVVLKIHKRGLSYIDPQVIQKIFTYILLAVDFV